MSKIKRHFRKALAAALAANTLTAGAQQEPLTDQEKPAVKDPNATQFIRVARDENNVRLQTGITTYAKNDITVDLIGAIHIADTGYYTQLNKEFKNYDALLFEMIGGGNMKNGKAVKVKKKAKDPMVAMLGDIHNMIGKMLKLQAQKQGIDYTAANFVHADLSLAEFEKLQEKKGESILGFAMQNAQPGMKQPDLQKLLTALLSGNADGMKLELVDTLGGAGNHIASMLGDSVIIDDRNNACLKVLGEQVKVGKKKLGIFYGAAHFSDMESELLKMGYKKTSHRWLTAWDIPKAAAKPLPDKKSTEVPDAA
ncbi:MAG: hypothetical protein AB8F34_00625 [Akkermansiaceae bacterium]